MLVRTMLTRNGMTLVELIAAAVIGSAIAGGTLMAFTTAVRLSQRSSNNVQVAQYAQETLEKFRNHVACDDRQWYDATTCQPLSPSGVDALPSSHPSYVTARTYQVTPKDLDGNGVNESSEVQVTVNWTPPQ